MKKNRGLFIALAAGITVAGLVAFLFTTETGKKMKGQWKNKGKKMVAGVDDILGGARSKMSNLKDDISKKVEKMVKDY